MPLIIPSNSQSASGYTIDQSIRFSTVDNPALSKNFSGAGTEETWTFSCWFKRGAKEETRNMIFSAGSAGSSFGGLELGHGAGTSYGRAPLIFYNYTSGSYDWRLQTTRAFSDFSAWYHVTVVSDTTNPVSSERARIYINGVRVTSFSSAISAPTFPALNFSGNHWMGTTEHDIGTSIFTTQNFDGYLAEIYNIDGQALDCNSFGEFNSSGIWVPKKYSGSFGTNGFHIDGRDSSDLGDDESGQGNDFSSSGLAAHDQMIDTPNNNFCVLNPISSSGLASGELTGGNLEMRNIDYIDATLPFPTSGKWYYELCVVSKTQGNWNYGNHYFRDIVDNFPDSNFTDYITTNFYHGSNFHSSSNWTDGDFWTNSNNPSAGDIYGFAWDSDTKKLWLAKNNTYFGSGNPAGNSGTPLGSGGIAGVEYVVTLYSTLSQVMTLNFGQDDTFNNAKTSGSAGAADDNGNGKFYYAPPTGFLALCTKNLGAE